MRLKSLLLVSGGDAIAKSLLLAINLYLINRLSIGDYAKYTALLNILFAGYQLVCAPLERLYIAQHDAYKDRIGDIYGAMLILVCAGVTALTYALDTKSRVLLIAGVCMLSSYQMYRIKLQQQLAFSTFVSAEVVRTGLWLLVILFIVDAREAGAADAIILSLVITTLVARLGFGIFAGKFDNRARRFFSVSDVGLIWNARYVVAYTLIAAVIPYLPLAMASAAHNAEVLATYGATQRYVGILGMVVFAVGTSLLPHMAQASIGNAYVKRLLHLKVMKQVMSLAVAMCIVVVVVWFAIPVIDGGKYPSARPVFLVAAATPIFSLLGLPFINGLLMDGRARAVMYCMALAVGVTAIFYLVLPVNVLQPAIASLMGYLTVTATTAWIFTARKRSEAI